MLALTVDLPTGRFYACAYNDRTAPEWPPHPARLFSALVAALPAPDEGDDAGAAAALEWLEAQPPPAIAASRASTRRALDVYVPVNDIAVVDDSRVEKATAALEEATAARAAATTPKAVAQAEKAIEKAAVAVRAATVAATAAAAKPAKDDLNLVRKRFDENGLRQRRFFPSVTPEVPSVTYLWPTAEAPPGVRAALGAIAARVGRLGHSASLVSVRIDDDPPPPTLVPSAQGTEILRVVGPGQLASLRAAWLLHRETDPRVLPARFVTYGAPDAGPAAGAPPRGAFGPPESWVLLRRAGGARLPISAAVGLARQVRRVLLAHGGTPSPEILAGHRPDGSATDQPHLAVVPLPFVDHPHADGALLGVALVLPADCSAASRQAALAAMARWEATISVDDSDHDEGPPVLSVPLGPAGVIQLQRVLGPAPLATLDGHRWCRAARAWATVTPIALDRNPGNLDARDPARASAAADEAARIIRAAVMRQGLPAPVRVEIHAAPGVLGSRPVRDFPSFPPDPGKTRRVRVHAHILFDTPIRGPLLLGAGRYAGLGLCRPLPESDR